MKYYSFCPFIVALIFSSFCLGQNLVPNPSFEEYLDCPYSTADFQNQVIDWYSFNETPDYFNICSNDIEGFAGVPSNAWGYQYPVTGDAYAGVVTYVHYSPDGREYMACPIEQLTIGDEYYIMFYISHSNIGVYADWQCATNHFGLKFFKDPPYNSDLNPYTPQNTADIDYNQMLVDTANWHLVEGWFTADQAYNWIALGNFYDDAHTDTLQLGNPENELNECLAIYYIDNVCISKNPADCQYLLSTHLKEKDFSIQVYPNPSTDGISIESPDYSVENIKVFNVTGKLIFNGLNLNKNIFYISTNQWASGIYLLQLELDDNLFYQTKIMKE